MNGKWYLRPMLSSIIQALMQTLALVQTLALLQMNGYVVTSSTCAFPHLHPSLLPRFLPHPCHLRFLILCPLARSPSQVKHLPALLDRCLYDPLPEVMKSPGRLKLRLELRCPWNNPRLFASFLPSQVAPLANQSPYQEPRLQTDGQHFAFPLASPQYCVSGFCKLQAVPVL